MIRGEKNVMENLKPETRAGVLGEALPYLQDYYFAPHWDRYDHSSFMLRYSMPRVKFKEKATVQDSGFT